MEQHAVRDILRHLVQSPAQDLQPQNGVQTHDRPFGRRQPPGRIENFRRDMTFANVVQLRAQSEQCCRRQALMGVTKGLSHAGDTITVAIKVKTGLLCQRPELAVFRTR
ncbi:hypothetical protein AA18895_2495 [Acetobacter ghanensis DSM 18895]|nr:hypothetical protein AA18895_2495 [Acetobacter ghanensis DSM 18895]